MKYNHIIYNSSQTTRDGRPGFGERAVTIGTDPALLTALAEANIYGFEYSHPKLSPTALASDPSLIRLIEPMYFFTFVESGNSKTWIVGRKIAVGFDYMFYANGTPTRLGNYVADIYAFDNVPDRSVFEALYESPAPGSVHFIPSSPEPRADNIEMRAISLDRPQDLAPEDRVFEAAQLPAVDPRAVKLLFAFLAHLTNGRPVAAVIDDRDATSVIGSFMRIIPQELIPKATFITNFNETGIPKNFAVVCVDPENISQFMPAVWNVVNLTDPAPYDSVEAGHLMPEFEKALASGDNNRLLNLARWLFSSEYRAVKDLDADARETGYRYVIESSSVTPDVLDKALGNDGSVTALARVISGGASTAVLDRYFDSRLAAASTVKDLKALVDSLMLLDGKGLHCAKDALVRARGHIDAVMLASAKSLEEFFLLAGASDKSSLTPYAELIDLESLRGKRNAFLSALSSKVWEKLYPLFFTSPVAPKALIKRALDDKQLQPSLNSAIAAAVSQSDLVNVAVELILENDGYSDTLLPILRQLQDNGITPAGKRYFDIFKDRRNDPKFADLMVNEYSRSVPLSPAGKEVERIEQIAAHPTLLKAVSDTKLSNLLSSLKAMANAGGQQSFGNVAALCDRLLALPVESKVKDDIRLLSEILRGDYKADAKKVAHTAVEIGDADAVVTVMPRLSEAQTDPDTINTVVEFLAKKGVPRTDMLKLVIDSTGKSLGYWLAALYAGEKKNRGAVIVTELQGAGLEPEKAVAILEKSFPDDYRAYLKSLEPNIFVKFGCWVKSLFSKPKNDDGADSGKPSEHPKAKKEAKDEAPRQSGKDKSGKDKSAKPKPGSQPQQPKGDKQPKAANTPKAPESPKQPAAPKPAEAPKTPESPKAPEVPERAMDADEIINNGEDINLT